MSTVSVVGVTAEVKHPPGLELKPGDQTNYGPKLVASDFPPVGDTCPLCNEQRMVGVHPIPYQSNRVLVILKRGHESTEAIVDPLPADLTPIWCKVCKVWFYKKDVVWE